MQNKSDDIPDKTCQAITNYRLIHNTLGGGGELYQRWIVHLVPIFSTILKYSSKALNIDKLWIIPVSEQLLKV